MPPEPKERYPVGKKAPRPYAPTVLVADDDPDSRRALRRPLEELGYFVIEAATGRTAWEAARERFFDLIILDLSMPDTDGIELIRSIRAELPHLRVIAVSGFLSGSLLGIAQKLGASGALQKPVPEATLLTEVCRVLGNSPTPI
jgi:CheY-like chemotaxis protein